MAAHGYARVSIFGQDLASQRAALEAAGCKVIGAETAKGSRRDGRTELQVPLDFVQPGDTLMVTRIDPKMAQKLMEEAAETAINAVRNERAGFVNESADLLYNLVVPWSALGVAPDEVWAEMDRREALLGMAERLPKVDDAGG